MSNYNDPIFEAFMKSSIKSADYAGTLGFSRATFNLILNAVESNDYERIKSLTNNALEQINNVFNKYNLNE